MNHQAVLGHTACNVRMMLHAEGPKAAPVRFARSALG
jgi:hypothetical protein